MYECQDTKNCSFYSLFLFVLCKRMTLLFFVSGCWLRSSPHSEKPGKTWRIFVRTVTLKTGVPEMKHSIGSKYIDKNYEIRAIWINKIIRLKSLHLYDTKLNSNDDKQFITCWNNKNKSVTQGSFLHSQKFPIIC